MLFAVFVIVFSGSFEESLADPSTTGDLLCGDGLASCPQPSGKPWHYLPKASSAHSPDPVPALLLPPATQPSSLLWRHHLYGDNFRSIGPTGARGSKGGKGAHAGQPLSGTHAGQDAASLIESLAAEPGRSWSHWGMAGLGFQ